MRGVYVGRERVGRRGGYKGYDWDCREVIVYGGIRIDFGVVVVRGGERLGNGVFC